MNMQLKKIIVIKKILVAISLLLFALACYNPAFITEGSENEEASGLFSLLFGWIGLLFHMSMGLASVLFYMSWFANISYICSIFFFLKNNRDSFYLTSVSTLVLGIFPLLVLLVGSPEMLVNESGGDTVYIECMCVGYYLWISSFVVLLLGGVWEAARHKAH